VSGITADWFKTVFMVDSENAGKGEIQERNRTVVHLLCGRIGDLARNLLWNFGRKTESLRFYLRLRTKLYRAADNSFELREHAWYRLRSFGQNSESVEAEEELDSLNINPNCTTRKL
jgi:hypothetical protein